MPSTTKPDVEVTRSGEFDVAHVGGITDAGAEFVDAYLPPEDGDMVVVDSGRIVVRASVVDALVEECSRRGLAVAVEAAP